MGNGETGALCISIWIFLVQKHYKQKDGAGWSLGYLLMELAPGCDVAGTDIFLEVA